MYNSFRQLFSVIERVRAATRLLPFQYSTNVYQSTYLSMYVIIYQRFQVIYVFMSIYIYIYIYIAKNCLYVIGRVRAVTRLLPFQLDANFFKTYVSVDLSIHLSNPNCCFLLLQGCALLLGCSPCNIEQASLKRTLQESKNIVLVIQRVRAVTRLFPFEY